MTTKERTQTPTETCAEASPKQGFFKRIFAKIDSAMKTKTDSNDCCGGNGKSGGKCC